MSSERKVVVLSLDLNSLIYVASIIVLIVLAAWIMIYDYSVNYVWVIPLDHGREVFTYYKSNIIVNIYNVVDNYRSIIGLSGVTGKIIVASSGDYSIIYAGGLNAYVSAIAILTPIIYIAVTRKMRKLIGMKTNRGLLMTTLLLLLFILPLVSLVFYVNNGFNNGFAVSEEPVRVLYFKDLNYAVTNVTGSPQYVYIIRDEVQGGLALVAFKTNLGDQVLPIVALDVATPSGRYSELTYTKSLYLVNSVLNITVISPAPLVNSSLTYYKAVFREMSSETPPLITLTPVLMLATSTVLGYVTGRIVGKQGEARRD
ncbi:MAG: hypothetical protein QXE10_02065 [Desulfurococcaceae archaeon]